MPRLLAALGVPDIITLPSGQHLPGMEALCILLRRLAYPNRLADLVRIFRRPASTLSRTINYMAHWLHQRHGRLLYWDSERINANVMQAYAAAVNRKGAPLPNCIGFIDGTVRPLCRPSRHQRQLYNGHKRQHAIKFQSVMAPDGLIIHLSRPFPGRRAHSVYEVGQENGVERFA